MNKKLISAILILGVVIIAVITNPKKKPHAKEISLKLNPDENKLFKASYELLTEQLLDYENYVVFSIAKYDTVKSLGVFGNVFILSNDTNSGNK